uniref:HipN domain-containing protein n=1 Tax=Parastrongyloides trichosuri TaxID=131310 RepID=A0A0N4Z6R9_PARTI
MEVDFETRLRDFTDVVLSDPHILMSNQLKFFRDFLISLGVDRRTFTHLIDSVHEENYEEPELFDALEAASYGNLFLRQGKYSDAIDAYTNASQLAGDLRYFQDAKYNVYDRMSNDYSPSSPERFGNVSFYFKYL